MRTRSTWKTSETPRQAATSRTADPYSMNQEHPQPAADEYANGSPDTWAETPVPGDKMSVNEEYSGDAVKRNEIGMGEFRNDTFNHKDSDKWNNGKKYDNAKVSAERRANAAELIARKLLRTTNEKAIQATAVGFMGLPPRTLVATLNAIKSVSPDSLSEDSKFRRALACTKLSARILGEDPNSVRRLASVLMSIDDPTLKAMIKIVAASRVAAEDEKEDDKEEEDEKEDKKESKTSQKKDDDKDDEKSEPKTSQKKDEEKEEAPQAQTSQQECGLSGDELSMLNSMTGDATPAAPVQAPPPAGGESLESLFTPPAGQTLSDPSGKVQVEITFDEGDESALPALPALAAQGMSMEALFADNEEVQAQRTLQAAQRDASQVSRTASARGPAKKLGSVQASPAVSPAMTLAAIWDLSPGPNEFSKRTIY